MDHTGGILVLGDRLLVDGMRIAGVSDSIYCDERSFEKELLRVMNRQDVTIVITPIGMLSKVSWRTKQLIENTAKPIVIGVADYMGNEEESESIAWLIKKALGFDLSKS